MFVDHLRFNNIINYTNINIIALWTMTKKLRKLSILLSQSDKKQSFTV
jgi:hypothetical protein